MTTQYCDSFSPYWLEFIEYYVNVYANQNKFVRQAVKLILYLVSQYFMPVVSHMKYMMKRGHYCNICCVPGRHHPDYTCYNDNAIFPHLSQGHTVVPADIIL